MYGLIHALDADHIAAVSTIVSKQKKIIPAMLTGVSWGIGHTSVLLVAGFVMLLFKISIPEKLAMSFEFLVGAMITFLGASVIYNTIKDKKHVHIHTHDGSSHVHVHSHNLSETHHHYHKPFFIGLFHGLAGSAALMLLVLSTINDLTTGLLYVLIFGIGSIIGMAGVGALLSLPFILTKELTKFNNILRYVTGSLSVMFGLYLMFTLGKILLVV